MIYKWALEWGVSPAALQDLFFKLGLNTSPRAGLQPHEMKSESRVQSEKRLEVANNGDILWRNNSGACVDEKGRSIRYGLANDSKRINKVFKSSDLIGIKKVLVTQEMIGRSIGVFYARECKPEGWTYTGTEREVGQLNFINKVNSMGGDARFCSGESES